MYSLSVLREKRVYSFSIKPKVRMKVLWLNESNVYNTLVLNTSFKLCLLFLSQNSIKTEKTEGIQI